MDGACTPVMVFDCHKKDSLLLMKGILSMGLLPDTQSCGLCMRRECRERSPRHRRETTS